MRMNTADARCPVSIIVLLFESCQDRGRQDVRFSSGRRLLQHEVFRALWILAYPRASTTNFESQPTGRHVISELTSV